MLLWWACISFNMHQIFISICIHFFFQICIYCIDFFNILFLYNVLRERYLSCFITSSSHNVIVLCHLHILLCIRFLCIYICMYIYICMCIYILLLYIVFECDPVEKENTLYIDSVCVHIYIHILWYIYMYTL